MFGDVKRHFKQTTTEVTCDDIRVTLEAHNGGIDARVYECGTELDSCSLEWAPDPIHALADKYGGTWGQHPNYPLEDWTYEVGNGDTRLGYWEWVDVKLQAAEEGSPK